MPESKNVYASFQRWPRIPRAYGTYKIDVKAYKRLASGTYSQVAAQFA